MSNDELTAMAAFYREVDADVSALAADLEIACEGCGDCCRFDKADHVLYASGLEKKYLLASLSGKERSGHDTELLARGLRCPFQHDGKCRARTGRVLGCRLHYCDPRWAEMACDLAERWHRRLKTLHDDLGVEWRYAPLLPLEGIT